MSHNKGQSRGTINHCTRFNYNLIIIKVFNYGVNTTYNVPYATQAVKVWILINQKTKKKCQQNTTNKQTQAVKFYNNIEFMSRCIPPAMNEKYRTFQRTTNNSRRTWYVWIPIKSILNLTEYISGGINYCGFYFRDSVYSPRNRENKNPVKIFRYTVWGSFKKFCYALNIT